jgi:hypothetical protein
MLEEYLHHIGIEVYTVAIAAKRSLQLALQLETGRHCTTLRAWCCVTMDA